MSKKINVFQIKDYAVLGNFMKRLHELWSDGEEPFVEIKVKKDDRSNAQNRTMHLWFKEIAESTKHELWYEVGRCKERYFLPVLKASDRKEAKQAYWIAMTIKKRLIEVGKPEAFYETLYSGATPSTRFLSSKEFSIALEHMYQCEAEHNLTNPGDYGWNI